MKTQTVSLSAIAAVVALAMAPAASQADTGIRVVDACVKSFVDTYLPDRTVRGVKTMGDAYGSFASDREYTVVLAAHGAKSGRLIAEARCVAKGNGIVVVLDSEALAKHKRTADFLVSLR